ncbi:unnamed protein product, partial [Mesorhabditis spiculigera]
MNSIAQQGVEKVPLDEVELMKKRCHHGCERSCDHGPIQNEHVVGQDASKPNADDMHFSGDLTREGQSQHYKGHSDKNKYLDQYGYAGKYVSIADEIDAPMSMTSKIGTLRNFQKWAGLRATGILDKATKDKMMEPRCGVADVQQIRPAPKWPSNRITYSILAYSKRFPQDVTQRLIAEAFQYWAAVAPLEFVEVQSDPNIKIKFARGAHQDNNAFDGPGNVLGHAFGPEFGGLHFDDDEEWADFSVMIRDSDVDFLSVAIHEIGHVLGIGHIRDSSAIMHPWYDEPTDDRKNYVVPKLNHDDIQAITDLYGSKTAYRTDSALPGISGDGVPPDTSDEEELPWNLIAIAVHANGQDTLLFDGQNVHRVLGRQIGHSKDLSGNKFATSPRLKAAVYDMWLDMVLLFAEEGKHIIVYGADYGQFIGRRPMTVKFRRNLPQRPPFAIQGALSSVAGQIWLIGHDGHYAELDPETFAIVETGHFGHLPTRVKGGHKDSDGGWRLYTEHETLHLDSDGGRIRDNSPILDPRTRSRPLVQFGDDERPRMKLRRNSDAMAISSLATERMIALLLAETYSTKPYRYVSIIIMGATTFWSIINALNANLGVANMEIFVALCLFHSIFSGLSAILFIKWNDRKRRQLWNDWRKIGYSLAKRYQITENVKAAKILLTIIIFALANQLFIGALFSAHFGMRLAWPAKNIIGAFIDLVLARCRGRWGKHEVSPWQQASESVRDTQGGNMYLGATQNDYFIQLNVIWQSEPGETAEP